MTKANIPRIKKEPSLMESTLHTAAPESCRPTRPTIAETAPPDCLNQGILTLMSYSVKKVSGFLTQAESLL